MRTQPARLPTYFLRAAFPLALALLLAFFACGLLHRLFGCRFFAGLLGRFLGRFLRRLARGLLRVLPAFLAAFFAALPAAAFAGRPWRGAALAPPSQAAPSWPLSSPPSSQLACRCRVFSGRPPWAASTTSERAALGIENLDDPGAARYFHRSVQDPAARGLDGIGRLGGIRDPHITQPVRRRGVVASLVDTTDVLPAVS